MDKSQSTSSSPKSEAAHVDGWKAQTEYLGEYFHRGSRWGFNFFAIDDEDAKQKLESIKSSLALLGPLALRIPFEAAPKPE